MPSTQATTLLPSIAALVRYAPWRQFDDIAALAVPGQREQECIAHLHHPGRRREWLASRLVAKQVIADAGHDVALQDVEILPSATTRRPQVWICRQIVSYPLSIAHSSRGVLVALALKAETCIGIDLTEQTALSPSFVRLWFTADECRWLDNTSLPFAANRLWAIKEAVYKACNRGEGFNPRHVSAVPKNICYRGVPVDCHLETFEFDEQFAAIVTIATTFNHPMQELHS